MIPIDGAYGEGGGQVLRSALTLSAITGEAVRVEGVRAGRSNPGLAPQHLTAIRALAQTCGASVHGAALHSTRVEFVPGGPPAAGEYRFDVAEAASGGSAGAATLILQAMLLPLALAAGPSRVTASGGTHVPWSPSFHYFDRVYLPVLARLGLRVTARLDAWGFYPVGGGRLTCVVDGRGRPPAGLELLDRGPLTRVSGLGVAANLPAHIAQRIADRARKVLSEARLPADVRPERVRALGPGAGAFLVAEYENCSAGFGALGRKGKPSEQVAEEAALDLLAHHRSGQPVDMHLADQLLLPLALAEAPSSFAACRVTPHLLTNAYVIEQFLPVAIQIDGEPGQPGVVRLER